MKAPHITVKTFRNILLTLVILIGVFSGGYVAGAKGLKVGQDKYPKVTINRSVPDKRNLDFDLFWQVWDQMELMYFDKSKLVPAKMVYGAIKGMVAAVGDPYTIFLDPEENKITSEDLGGNFEGIGIQIGFRGTQLAIIAPLPGSPAEKAGAKSGDYIIGIKDEEKDIDHGTVGMTLPEAVQEIRGKAGTKVTITLLREGTDEPLVLDIVRGSIDVPSVTVEYLENEKLAHVRILKFGGETEAEWNKVITEVLRKSSVNGIILDVRNNPGGYLQGAVDIGGDFLGKGKVVVIEESGSGARDEYRSNKVGRLLDIPTVVLMNKGSASASEILAGALRDQKGIKLIGTTSFGKGTIQEREELSDDVALHITSAKWLTPKGTWVHDKGLEPDITVEDKAETPEDEQLTRAIEVLGK